MVALPQLNINILYVLEIWFLKSGFSIENKYVYCFCNNIQGWNKINEEKIGKKTFSKLQNMFFFFSISLIFGVYNFLLFVSCDLKILWECQLKLYKSLLCIKRQWIDVQRMFGCLIINFQMFWDFAFQLFDRFVFGGS
jgi:hypothetical protein